MSPQDTVHADQVYNYSLILDSFEFSSFIHSPISRYYYRLDSCVQKWNVLWQNSQLYIERLKGVEIVLNGLDEATKFVSRLEVQLASSDNMPSEPEALRKIHDDLVEMQSTMQMQQGIIDQLADEVGTVRHLVVKSRGAVNATLRKHQDVDRLEAEVNTVVSRWSTICSQVIDRYNELKKKNNK